MDSENINSPNFHRNMGLIDLAAECVFITSPEKETILKLLDEKTKEDPDIDVLALFKQEELISDKRLEYLVDLFDHLALQQEDQQFGRLAVVNGLVSKENVDSALAYQQHYFRQVQVNKKIGDILLENRVISQADRMSILLTQNRIKNENLLDAIHVLGKTQTQKDSVNKRFGALAIKKQVATLVQVKAALDIQKNERLTQGNSRFLGQILQETADLDDEDILAILLEQKQVEKRTLDLERALYTAKSEMKISQKFNQLFSYRVSRDGLEVFVEKRRETDETILVYELIVWLRRVGIRFGVVDDGVLEDFIHNAEIKIPVLAARGYPPEQAVDESVRFSFENEFTMSQDKSCNDRPDNQDSDGEEPDSNQPDQEKPDKEEPDKDDTDKETPDSEKEDKEPADKEPADQKPADSEDPKPPESDSQVDDESENKEEQEKAPPVLMKKGSVLAQVVPGEKGKPGRDVLGYLILPDKPGICFLNAGKGVIRKGAVFLAQIDGFPVLKHHTTLMVEPLVKESKLKTIKGSIGEDTQDTYESAVVEMRGTIAPGGILRCGSLLLHGSVMGSVTCTDSIIVHGDIGGDETPEEPQTSLQTVVMCQGTIKASFSVINSKIDTDYDFLALNSSVTGSEVTAGNGMTIKDSLNGKTRPCVLWFGLKPGDRLIAQDHAIDTRRAEISLLKKEAEIAQITKQFHEELAEEQHHQLEQLVMKNLMEIIRAPEFFKFDDLGDKVKYLYDLPDFSSVRSHYLKIPDTEAGTALVNQFLKSVENMPLDQIFTKFKEKIDPEPEDDSPGSDTHRSEMVFNAGLSALEQEVVDGAGEIETLEEEIKNLDEMRTKGRARHLNSLSQSKVAIRVKNKCEKGTIIKGKIARLVVETTLYNVTFREVVNPITRTVSIVIDT